MTNFVNAELDRRHPERVQFREGQTADDVRAIWDTIERLWAQATERAGRLPAAAVDQRVNEEWSFAQTLRHLVFITDAWASRTVLDEEMPYHPLGLPQSWAVISGAGDPARASGALEAAARRLVREGPRLIQLFDPAFDKSSLEPGYIKGYAPGVRENGGQYTHGAIWTVMAFALSGQTDRAFDLFMMVNPVTHAQTPADAERYKVEPYVMAADIYSVPPHAGRGGWSWSRWRSRRAADGETILGLKSEPEKLRIQPRIPSSWKSFKVRYRFRQTNYEIIVSGSPGSADAKPKIHLDGNEQPGDVIALVDDHREHRVEVQFG